MTERAYVAFQEVKIKVSIPDALQALGIADGFSQKNGSLTGVCPLPSHQHGPHPNPEQFKVRQKDGVWLWHCFGDCQRGGDIIELVKEITGHDNAHVRFWFADHFGDRLTARKPSQPRSRTPTQKSEPIETENSPVPDASTAPNSPPPLKPLSFFLNLDSAVPYLEQRGLKTETIQHFGLGLCRKGVLAGYIAIPIYGHPRDPNDNPLGYVGRWTGNPPDSVPRYKFPNEFPRNRVIYGLSEALKGTEGLPLIVVEGPFKVFHLFQSGFPNCVATFGASVSDEQIEILIATGRPIISLFDGDEAGQSGMDSLSKRMFCRTFLRTVRLPTEKGPDDLSPSELHALLE